MMGIYIEIDDALLTEAMEATGAGTKRTTVEHALRTLIRLRDEVATLRDLELVHQVLARGAVGQSRPSFVRTNIEIDDDLLAGAMRATASGIKSATVDEALRTVVRLFQSEEGYRGTAGDWLGG